MVYAVRENNGGGENECQSTVTQYVVRKLIIVQRESPLVQESLIASNHR
jgi:hypothetical protein